MAIAKKKKKFFDIDIPLIGKIGQARAFEISELDGKFLKYDLTRILRGKATIFQGIIKADTKSAEVIPKKLQLMYYYLSRMVRKGTNYVEDSFSAECKNARLKIKPLLVTRKKVSRAVRKALRNKCKEELTNYVKLLSAEQVFDDILKNKLQKTLSAILKKIYPLSCCEIRVIQVENFLKEPAKPEKKEAGKKTEEKKEDKATKKKVDKKE